MKTRMNLCVALTFTLTLLGVSLARAQQATTRQAVARPQGPCDIYAAAGDPCVAAHSTTRALYASYRGPLYQVLRQSDGKTLDVGVVEAAMTQAGDAGGYADAAAQDSFCANTYCWITVVYDQSPKHNNLIQAPRGGFSGPAMGGFNNLPLADMAPVTIMGHKAYGVFIEPGMGLRNDDPKGTAVDDQAEGQYWVINGKHFNSGCCFDYGNAETDSRDDDNGTMETTFYGDTTPWYHGNPPGPWVMTDQENNLVGCVNADGSKLCRTLPSITWRFVTAMAKGEPHHWTSMGGDAREGSLQVMFDGPRVNATYDPMRKQGAILLGNGGDNSNGSQGTFYEGAMTAAGTFPKDATDQLVQANVVAAKYDVARLSLAPASAVATPPGLQTFSPGSSQETTVTFTNTTEAPVNGLKLGITPPGAQWSVVATGSTESSKLIPDAIAPGASVSATFKVTSGPAPFNGDLVARAAWTSSKGGAEQVTTAAEKVRNVSQVKINEFRMSGGSTANTTDSYIELYNAGQSPVDLSRWSLTEHPAQQAIFSALKVPAGTKLGPGRFYVFALSGSGLAVAARAGENVLHVRSTSGMAVGDTIKIDNGSGAETRKVTKIGTAAANHTTVWQPLPDGPVITIPAGSTNVPVQSVAGFTVGEKIALGHGATYPVVGRGLEQYEVATVTAVGKPGTQAYLAVDAAVGTTNIKVTSVADISVGDTIRLDIESVDHGIEMVKVTSVGKRAPVTNLSADASAGATRIKVRNVTDFMAGDTLTIGTPANHETVTLSAVSGAGPTAAMEFTPALSRAHIDGETVVSPGTGLELAAPLRFKHAANMPFSDRGTGISFSPASAFAHSSNEPVQALGSGIVLDRALAQDHAINAALRDATVTTAGYQGSTQPDQWFGGPELTTYSPQFGRTIPVREGSLVLRDASGLVVDSLNYGGLVDPWAAQGYQGASGAGHGGCFVPAPNPSAGFGPPGTAADASNRSAGRFPDGADTASNCTDFRVQAATTMPIASVAGATNLKVAGVAGFSAGQTIRIGSGSEFESAVLATVGTAGGTTVRSDTSAGATSIPVENGFGFTEGETITLDAGANAETAVVSSIRRFGPTASITLLTPLSRSHAAGEPVAGSGITLTAPLTHAHAGGTQVAGSAPPTPGAANQY